MLIAVLIVVVVLWSIGGVIAVYTMDSSYAALMPERQYWITVFSFGPAVWLLLLSAAIEMLWDIRRENKAEDDENA